jgi:hydroxymethylglutaryl-CoA reductase (NADPH)
MATSFISKRLRSTEEEQEVEPGWLRRQIVSGLQSISRRACVHPIHTIVVIALLASTTYVGLLEGSLLDTVRDPRNVAGQVDTDALLQGSRNLRLGESTSWKWQAEDAWADSEVSSHRLLFYFGSITDKMV